MFRIPFQICRLYDKRIGRNVVKVEVKTKHPSGCDEIKALIVDSCTGLYLQGGPKNGATNSF